MYKVCRTFRASSIAHGYLNNIRMLTLGREGPGWIGVWLWIVPPPPALKHGCPY